MHRAMTMLGLVANCVTVTLTLFNLSGLVYRLSRYLNLNI